MRKKTKDIITEDTITTTPLHDLPEPNDLKPEQDPADSIVAPIDRFLEAEEMAKNKIIKESLIEVTPYLMSLITRYSESTCRQMLSGVYPNPSATESALQQVTIFVRDLQRILHDERLLEIVSFVIDGKKVRKGDNIRLAVQLEAILRKIQNKG